MTSPIVAVRLVDILGGPEPAFAVTRVDTIGHYPEYIRLGHFFTGCTIAGALHRAFLLGIYAADGYAPDGGRPADDEQPWRPNTEGRSAM